MTLKNKRDIIPYIEQNYSSKEIGQIFSLSTPTIDRYIRDLRDNGYLTTPRPKGRKKIRL